MSKSELVAYLVSAIQDLMWRGFTVGGSRRFADHFTCGRRVEGMLGFVLRRWNSRRYGHSLSVVEHPLPPYPNSNYLLPASGFLRLDNHWHFRTK